MQMHHAASGGPLENTDISARSEYRHHDRLKREFQSNCALPGDEKRILVHEFPPLALAQFRVVWDSFDFCDYAYDPVPRVPLRSERTAHTLDLAKVWLLMPRLLVRPDQRGRSVAWQNIKKDKSDGK